jgi:hypothetical protein
MDTSYTVFVHLVGEGGAGAIRAQQDSIPHNGEWPTTGWVKGEVVTDRYELTVAPDTPSGTYHLIAGMYKADTGQRLTATAGNNNPLGDFIRLTEITIKKHKTKGAHRDAPLSTIRSDPTRRQLLLG